MTWLNLGQKADVDAKENGMLNSIRIVAVVVFFAGFLVALNVRAVENSAGRAVAPRVDTTLADQGLTEKYQPIFRAFGLDRIQGLSVRFRTGNTNYAIGDREKLDKLLGFVETHPRPEDLALEAKWFVELSKLTPVVLFSLHAEMKGDSHFMRPGWGPYFLGEALLPVALLLGIHHRLYSEPAVTSLDQELADMNPTRPQSIAGHG